ncbi:MAG: hypothetical protein IJH77_05920, partial [Mogibacterium sp.]|nr:hypothetical protein [Mogibacterium sp.]
GTVTVTVTDGWQEITPVSAEVLITGHHDAVTYDGTMHTVTGYDVEILNSLYTAADFTFSGTASASREEIGTTQMGLAESQFENRNPNFTDVVFRVTDGYQTIVPVDEVVVTVTGHRTSSVYDGTAHEASGYDIEISNPLYTTADFAFSGTGAVSGTDAGEYPMGLDASQFSNQNENFRQVAFVVTDGGVAVTPANAEVRITGHQASAAYDGGTHTVSGYDFASANALYTESDFTFTGTDKASRIDAGRSPMGLDASQFANRNPNFGTVTFLVTDGWQEITPIDVTVTITGYTNTSSYDGQEHSVSGYTVEISNDLYTRNDFVFSGAAQAARINAGTQVMGLESEQFTNLSENFRNVTFEVTDGYQTIEPIDASVQVTGHTAETVYSGNEQAARGYDLTIANSLYRESDIRDSGMARAARIDAGTEVMGLTADQFTNISPNFRNVTFEIQDGSLTINPAAILVKTMDAEKIYDGTPLTAGGTIQGLMNGETAVLLTTGSQTEVGESVNTYRIDWKNELTTAKESNYTVEEELGTLAVAPLPTHTLTIHYVDENGNPLADPYTEEVEETVAYGPIVSPEIAGYLPEFSSIEGIMPEVDVEITVIYHPEQTVVPGGNEGPGGSGGNGGTDNTDGNGGTVVIPSAGVVTVDDGGVPKIETIGDDGVPASGNGYWALINLICAILTVILSLILAILYFFGRKKDEEEEDEREGTPGTDANRTADLAESAENEEEEEEEPELKRKGIFRILSILTAVISVIAFILTEDMSLPMQLIDRWTLLMVILLIIDILLAIFSKKKRKDEEEQEEQERA